MTSLTITAVAGFDLAFHASIIPAGPHACSTTSLPITAVAGFDLALQASIIPKVTLQPTRRARGAGMGRSAQPGAAR